MTGRIMTEKKKSYSRQRKFRFDAYTNNWTGLGSSSRDKAVLAQFQRSSKLSDNYLESLYHDNDVASRLVDVLPEEVFKRGYYLTVGDNEEYKDDLEDYVAISEYEAEHPEIAKIHMELDRLEAREKFTEAMIWARVFGGAALWVGVNDGNSQEEPVDERRIQSIDFIKVLDSRYIYPFETYEDPLDPKFGETKTYKIIPNSSATIFSFNTAPEAVVHESRIIPFHGTRTSVNRMRENRGWSNSLLQKCDEVLSQFGQSWQATAHLMTDAAQAVFKMAGLMESISAQRPEYISMRLADTDMNRSVARMIAVDAENGEDFRRDSYSFNGIPQILELFMLRLSLAARIPVTILMGQSPAGMNATGESDIRWFYDTVRSAQIHQVKPKLEYLIRLLMLSKKGPTAGVEPEKWAVCFPSPWQMNDFEKAEINKTRAETRRTLAEAELLEKKLSAELPVLPNTEMSPENPDGTALNNSNKNENETE